MLVGSWEKKNCLWKRNQEVEFILRIDLGLHVTEKRSRSRYGLRFKEKEAQLREVI